MQATDVYIDDLNCLAQGSPAQQQRVNEMVLQGINDIFPSLPDKIKDSISIKKDRQGDGDWYVQKEIFGCILNSGGGIFQLPPRQLTDLKALLDIPSTRRRIVVPKLCLLIGKLHSMHLEVPGVIRHFYHIQGDLTKTGTGTMAYLSNAFLRNRSHL